VRIQVVDTIYPEYAAEVYGRTPGLVEAPYEVQRRALWDASFGTSDAYVHHLAALGHETDGVIMNCPPLQAAWSAERRVPRTVARALMSRRGRRAGPSPLVHQLVLLAQVEAFRPDVLFVHDPWTIGDRLLDLLHRRVRLLVGQLASRPPPIARLRRFDLMLSSFPHFVDWWRSEGIDSELFRLAYYERVGERLASQGVDVSAEAEGRSGVVLSGGLSPKTYASVTPALERLCEEVDVDVWGYAAEELPSGSPILRGYRGPAWGLDMYRHMARAAVVVNRHGDIARGMANNMRLFEATGVGAAVLTEAAPNLHEMFEPGREMATYGDAEELVATVRSLLDDAGERRRLAAAGQRRTLAEHTYAERMRELSGLLEERLARRSYQST
jgi:spore maturation protein CgeB